MTNTTPSELVELKPCPFCGNDGKGPIEEALHIIFNEHDWRDPSWSVQCDKCTATMGRSDSDEEAIAAWNTRAVMPAIPVSPSELVERVAKAICEADKAQWFKEPAFTNELFRKLARAAIAAMPASPVGQPVAYALTDPTAVHVNMLRGTIAKPPPRAIWHIYGDELLAAMPAETPLYPADTVKALVEALKHIRTRASQAEINEYARCPECSEIEATALEALALVGGVSS